MNIVSLEFKLVEDDEYEAKTPFGKYSIFDVGNNAFWIYFKIGDSFIPVSKAKNSKEEALMICQKDFEDKIKSCII